MSSVYKRHSLRNMLPAPRTVCNVPKSFQTVLRRFSHTEPDTCIVANVAQARALWGVAPQDGLFSEVLQIEEAC